MIRKSISAGAATALLLTLSLGVAPAGTQEVDRKTVEMVRALTPPELDGMLIDTVWTQAMVISDLHQYDPVDHGDPTEETTIYLLYDDDFLEIILDPFNNMRTGYQFLLNPNGIRRDGVFEQPTVVNSDWGGIWYAEAVIDDEGWTAEVAIPFKTLNFDPANPDWPDRSSTGRGTRYRSGYPAPKRTLREVGLESLL